MTERRYEFTVLTEIWTQNTNDRIHWAHRADLVSAARMAARYDVKGAHIPAGIGRARIEVTPLQGRRGKLADPGAHLPTAKAAIDGMRDAGVLVDDTPKYVSSIVMHAPERGALGKCGLRMVLVCD